MKPKIAAVIVTYGNRFHLLSKVIDRLLDLNIHKIIVVNNNASSESYNNLVQAEKKLGKKLKVLHLNENTGSAYGYKVGIDYVSSSKICDFIWLLDDDNRPRENALDLLLNYWNSLSASDKNKKICLLSYRKGHLSIDQVMNNNPAADLGRNNTFRAFHLFEVIKKLFSRKKKPVSEETTDSVRSAITYVAPYGGMYFHRELVDVIGLPDEQFYLYCDDHEYSYRITKSGGSIIVLPDSEVEDIDESWHTKSKQSAVVKFAKSKDFIRLFYSARNRLYFEKRELVTSWLVYGINMSIFSIAVLLIALVNFNFKNINIYFKAVYAGFTGKLGLVEELRFF